MPILDGALVEPFPTWVKASVGMMVLGKIIVLGIYYAVPDYRQSIAEHYVDSAVIIIALGLLVLSH